jgi:hypothetical protein
MTGNFRLNSRVPGAVQHFALHRVRARGAWTPDSKYLHVIVELVATGLAPVRTSPGSQLETRWANPEPDCYACRCFPGVQLGRAPDIMV